MTFSASVTDFEDVSNSSGEIVTMYIVRVKYSAKATYFIAKRYSEFKDLYENMKALLPPDYKFPNKSLFNNSALFTKERRVKGFDQMLKELLRNDPLPSEIKDFLEFTGDRTREALERQSVPVTDRPRGRTTGSFDMRDSGTESVIESSPATWQQLSQTNCNNEEPPYPSSCNKKLESELAATIKKEFVGILSSSMKLSAVAYILLIILNLIDVTSSHFSSIVMTVVALGLLITFLRVICMKMEIRNAAQ